MLRLGKWSVFFFLSNRIDVKNNPTPRTSAHFSGGHVSISNWNDNDVPLPVLFSRIDLFPRLRREFFNRSPLVRSLFALLVRPHRTNVWRDNRKRLLRTLLANRRSDAYFAAQFTMITSRSWAYGFYWFSGQSRACHERLYEINHSRILL